MQLFSSDRPVSNHHMVFYNQLTFFISSASPADTALS